MLFSLFDSKWFHVQFEPQMFWHTSVFIHAFHWNVDLILCKLTGPYCHKLYLAAGRENVKPFLSHDHKMSFWLQSQRQDETLKAVMIYTPPHRMEATSALTHSCFLLSLTPQLPEVALARLLQSQGFVALQSISQSQKDGVNVFLLRRFLGWRLKQRKVVAVCETLRGRGGDDPAVPQVTLVAHHDAGHQGPHAVSAALLDPLGDALEGGEAGHVIDEDDGMDAAVVVLHHALPETLLTGRVPDLQLAQQRQILMRLSKGTPFFIIE